MAPSYNMTAENKAWYNIGENGNATVSVRSKKPLKPRAVYIGEASMQFMWVHTGKSSHWQFTPTLLNSTQAQYSEVADGQDQIINVDFGNRLFPASGLINTNLCGEIKAPAIHFDLPYAYDLWVFIIRSPWTPLKVTAEKSPLSINQGLAYATAEIEGTNTAFGDEPTLHSYVTMHGEGFQSVSLNLKRCTSHSATENTFGEIKFGAASYTWKPSIRNFDVILSTSSSMTQAAFVDFLKSFGAEAKGGFFGGLNGDFLLCDGPAIEYTLSLKGEKKYIGKEEDKTRIKLAF